MRPLFIALPFKRLLSEKILDYSAMFARDRKLNDRLE